MKPALVWSETWGGFLPRVGVRSSHREAAAVALISGPAEPPGRRRRSTRRQARAGRCFRGRSIVQDGLVEGRANQGLHPARPSRASWPYRECVASPSVSYRSATDLATRARGKRGISRLRQRLSDYRLQRLKRQPLRNDPPPKSCKILKTNFANSLELFVRLDHS